MSILDLDRTWRDLNGQIREHVASDPNARFTLVLIPHDPAIPCRVTVDGASIDADLSTIADPMRASKREQCVADAATFALSLRRSRR